MNDLVFEFDRAPWELAFEKLRKGDSISAVRFLTLLEGEEETAVEDALLELALDEGVLLGGGRELPFAEVEAELKEGSEEAVRAFAEALAAEFSLTEEKRSKHVRAMLLTQK